MSLRYGLGGEKPLSVAKIAVAHDVPLNRVRSTNERALRKLRRTLRDEEMFML